MKPIFSIVIPTLNEEKNLPSLFSSIIKKSKKFAIEIIIIDSGSTDKTISLLRHYKTKFYKFVLKEIKQSEFDHGGTRNLGAVLANGKYVLFMSADVNIISNDFFDRLNNDFKQYPESKAIFCKQIPNKKTSYIQSLDIVYPFENLEKFVNQSGLVIQNIYIPFIPYVAKYDYTWYFLSNTCACYQRAFLITHPFKETLHGEDLLMGMEIIKNGFTKIYDSKLIIQHSHNFTPFGYYKALLVDNTHKYIKLKLNFQMNLKTKIIKILNLDTSIFNKIYYVSLLLIYYGIKFLAFTTIVFTSLFLGKNMYKKIYRNGSS